MKTKSTFRFLATFAIATIISLGLSAQQTAVPGYSDGGTSHNFDSTGATSVTVGKTIPVFARPDLYYHPNYDADAGTGLTATHTWTWTNTVPANATLGTPGAILGDNYNTVTGVLAGSTVIGVTESGALCADATEETITINVLAVPSATISQTGTIDLCQGAGGLPGSAITATITDNSATDFHVTWSLEIYTEDNGGTADEWFDTDLSTSLGTSTDSAAHFYDLRPDETQTAPGTFNLTAVVPNVTINNKTTVYVYRLTSINDLTSRRGDFIGLDGTGDVNSFGWDEFQYYALAGQTLTVNVNPVPVTGPIYHISNTWAQ